jgi:hypothetical protein
MKDPDEVLLPSRNLVPIGFGEDESVERVPLALLDNLPLDLGHGSKIEPSVSRPLAAWSTCLTHLVSTPIASRTDRLS